jgi:hypothetical protein
MSTSTRTRILGATAAALVLVGGVAVTGPASAKASGVVAKSGDCSGLTNWKLKAKPRNGVLEVEFEVDSNRNGQVWAYTLRHDGRLTATGRRTTVAPSGSFTVSRRMIDAAGAHRITATAKNVRTGEICRAAIVI